MIPRKTKTEWRRWSNFVQYMTEEEKQMAEDIVLSEAIARPRRTKCGIIIHKTDCDLIIDKMTWELNSEERQRHVALARYSEVDLVAELRARGCVVTCTMTKTITL